LSYVVIIMKMNRKRFFVQFDDIFRVLAFKKPKGCKVLSSENENLTKAKQEPYLLSYNVTGV